MAFDFHKEKKNHNNRHMYCVSVYIGKRLSLYLVYIYYLSQWIKCVIEIVIQVDPRKVMTQHFSFQCF